MPDRLCVTGCGRPTRDVLLLCPGCLWALECDLGDVGWIDHQLETTLARQGVVAEQAFGSPSAEKPLPIHMNASRARSNLRNVLVGWVRVLADEPVAGPMCRSCAHGSCAGIRWHRLPEDRLPPMAAWLLSRVNVIAIHPAAQEIHGELSSRIGYAKRIVDLPANRTTFAVGPCPEAPCPGEVRAFVPADLDTPARLECQACQTRWDTTQWSRVGKRIMARQGQIRTAHIDSAMAAVLLGVTDRTIRRWVETGRLRNHGDDRHVLVDLAEAERAVDAA